MYFTKDQTNAQATNLKTATILICVDLMDATKVHDYESSCAPMHDSMIAAYDSTKEALFEIYDQVRDQSDVVLDDNLVNLAFNYAFDFTDGDAYHDYVDNCGGSPTVNNDDFNAVKNAMSLMFRSNN